MNEEELIRKHDAGTNPFRTPEGYFENFEARLKERMVCEGLMEQNTAATTKVVALTPFRRVVRYAAAAVVAGLCVAAGTYLYTQHDVEQTLASEETVIPDETLYDAFDYEMEHGLVNNTKIAIYLTEAY